MKENEDESGADLLGEEDLSKNLNFSKHTQTCQNYTQTIKISTSYYVCY